MSPLEIQHSIARFQPATTGASSSSRAAPDKLFNTHPRRHESLRIKWACPLNLPCGGRTSSVHRRMSPLGFEPYLYYRRDTFRVQKYNGRAKWGRCWDSTTSLCCPSMAIYHPQLVLQTRRNVDLPHRQQWVSRRLSPGL